MEKIKHIAAKKEKIIVYGTGKNGKKFAEKYMNFFDVQFWIDNAGIGEFFGKPVYKLEDLSKDKINYFILITPQGNIATEIELALKELGLQAYRDFGSAEAVEHFIDQGIRNPILKLKELSTRLYVYRQTDWQDIYTRNYDVKEEPKVKCYEGATALPPIYNSEIECSYLGGVVDDRQNFVAGYSQFENREEGFCAITASYEYNENNLVYRDERVLYAGLAINHIGEFIVNSLSRLWYLLENDYKGEKIVYFTLDGTNVWSDGSYDGISEWAYEFWELLGIKDKIELIAEPTRFREIIVPDQSLHFMSSFSNKFRYIIQKMNQDVLPANYEKIYLSKTKYRVNDSIPTLGEEYFEQFYSQKGYEVIHLEDYPVREKIAIINGAKEIVTTVGTTSHLATFFANENAKFILLNRNDDAPMTPQRILDRTFKINPIYVDVTAGGLPGFWQSGVILVGPNRFWAEFVKEYYDEEISEETIA